MARAGQPLQAIGLAHPYRHAPGQVGPSTRGPRPVSGHKLSLADLIGSEGAATSASNVKAHIDWDEHCLIGALNLGPSVRTISWEFDGNPRTWRRQHNADVVCRHES